jgi:excisionase family DNA binding protein
MEKLMTIAEVAEATTLKVSTIRKYVLKKTIPFVKLGGAVRFSPAEIGWWITCNGSENQNAEGKAWKI